MPVDVVLNVYDLIQQTPICCGFFHTGIEILGVEYCFAAGGGVCEISPRTAPDGRFRQPILLGSIESTSNARSAIDRLRSEFHGDAYSLVFRNCNDFSSAVSKAVLGRDIPGYINRLARIGRLWPIHHFLPAHIKGAGQGTATTEPLLATQPLFQGTGNTLAGAPASPQRTGFLSRLSRLFGRRGNSNASAPLVADSREARELRALAANRRLESGSENGNGAPPAAPMPNPWA